MLKIIGKRTFKGNTIGILKTKFKDKDVVGVTKGSGILLCSVAPSLWTCK